MLLYEPLFIDLGLLGEEVKKRILELLGTLEISAKGRNSPLVVHGHGENYSPHEPRTRVLTLAHSLLFFAWAWVLSL
jgi:hypothetical protein